MVLSPSLFFNRGNAEGVSRDRPRKGIFLRVQCVGMFSCKTLVVGYTSSYVA